MPANAAEIIRKVKEETGIDIKIISGTGRSFYIYENHIAENMKKKNLIYILMLVAAVQNLLFLLMANLCLKNHLILARSGY